MAQKPRPRPVARWPWDEVLLELAEISAIKAMAREHPVAIEALLTKIAGVDRVSFTAGGEDGRRATDFAEGKRWVASTLRQVIAARMPSSQQKQTGPHAQTLGPEPTN